MRTKRISFVKFLHLPCSGGAGHMIVSSQFRKVNNELTLVSNEPPASVHQLAHKLEKDPER
jgi:hypothetical protein